MTDADSWLQIFPSEMQQWLCHLPKETLEQLEEIRLRIGKPLELIAGGRSLFLDAKGEMTPWQSKAYRVLPEDMEKMLNRISRHSLYTLEEELRRGYVTVDGGHRIGLAGRVVLERGAVKGIRNISSFNVRIARQVIGAANQVLPYLWDSRQRDVYHTLILSPPQCGKTTLLRDLVRQLSYGHSPLDRGFKVGIVDERSEIAGCVRGVPQLDVGPRTDVLDSCPKAEGMMMLIRSMSPEVLVVDEIGGMEDAEALLEAVHAGVKVLATAHGHTLQDVLSRPALRRLQEEMSFQRIVILTRQGGAGSVKGIYDERGVDLLGRGERRS